MRILILAKFQLSRAREASNRVIFSRLTSTRGINSDTYDRIDYNRR